MKAQAPPGTTVGGAADTGQPDSDRAPREVSEEDRSDAGFEIGTKTSRLIVRRFFSFHYAEVLIALTKRTQGGFCPTPQFAPDRREHHKCHFQPHRAGMARGDGW